MGSTSEGGEVWAFVCERKKAQAFYLGVGVSACVSFGFYEYSSSGFGRFWVSESKIENCPNNHGSGQFGFGFRAVNFGFTRTLLTLTFKDPNALSTDVQSK